MITRIIFLISILLSVFAHAEVEPISSNSNSESEYNLDKTFTNVNDVSITMEQFASMSTKDYQSKFGKLSLLEKLGHKVYKRYIKKSIKNGTINPNSNAPIVADMVSNGFLWGFLLGFFLSWIGVIIALIWQLAGGKDEGLTKIIIGSILGMVASGILLGALYLLAFLLV